MALSPYTIEVGECQLDGTRTISLYHHRCLCFSTSHREVSRVCLTKWPMRRSVEEAVILTTADACEEVRAEATERAYQVVLESASAPVAAPADQTASSSIPTAEESPTMEDYLCVFHREEMADQYGRYSFLQPHAICTAYRVTNSMAVQLVLQNITPRDITPCAASRCGGVFVRGQRQSSKSGAPSSAAVEHDGMLYKPAVDLWWLGSALSVKPVYVAVGPVASLPGDFFPATSARENGVHIVASSLSLPDQSEDANAFSSPPGNIGLGDAPASPEMGRTAQGQFDFGSAPSPSPTGQELRSSTSKGDTARKNGDDASPLSSPLPGSGVSFQHRSPTEGRTRAKFVSVDATVLTVLELFDTAKGTRATLSPSSMAVVRTAPDEIGLALVTPQYAQDTMLWSWWPHRLRLPRLSGSSSALSIVASPHPSLSRQSLFLYDAHHATLRVLRTPDLHSGSGDLELLLEFPCGDLPFLLPCLHIAHPAPIAICNHPRPNVISVFDVPALLERPTLDAAVLQMDLGAHQAQHPYCFGEVLRGDGAREEHPAELYSTRNAGTDATRGNGKENATGSNSGICHAAVDARCRQRQNYSQSWCSDALSGSVAHPIRSLLYHCDGSLVLQYDYPGGTVSAERNRGYSADSYGEERGIIGTEGAHKRRQRRRCEGTISYTLDFPAVSRDRHPLLVLMLESLSAAVGPGTVASLEYQIFMESWRTSCGSGAVADPLTTCGELLKAMSVGAGSCKSAVETPASTGARATHQIVPLGDPLMLTLGRLRKPLEHNCSFSRNCSTSIPMWTIRQSGMVLVALHLLFESCRLQEPLWELLSPLAALNAELSACMGWIPYMEFYEAMLARPVPRRPFDEQKATRFTEALPHSFLQERFRFLGEEGESKTDGERSPPAPRSFVEGVPPDLFETLTSLVVGSSGATAKGDAACALWPVLHCLLDTHPISLANRIVLLYRSVFSRGNTSVPALSSAGLTTDSTDLRWWERVCTHLIELHISPVVVRQLLSTGVAYPLIEALTRGREQAAASWPVALLNLVGRRDRCPPTSLGAQLVTAGRHVVETAEDAAVARQFRVSLAEDDGVSVGPDFQRTWRDSRLDVAQNLFNTVTPISLAGYEDRPEELGGVLELLSSRVRAMPLGRGMLTMCTHNFKVQDSIPIPPLNLDGCTNDGIRVAHKSTEEMMWPFFHNGCAAGLRFLPLPPSFSAIGSGARGKVVEEKGTPGGALSTLHVESQKADWSLRAAAEVSSTAAVQTITKQWVMYQTKNIGNAASRAGLLLATGILGHLTVLQRTDIFSLLISRQEQYVWREATTMAVMLGLSCSFCGTGNDAVFRCLSVHVQSLNPSAEDIEVSLDVQTSALVSMGLLCQQSPSNTFLIEVFLVEISRLPTDEHCSKREGYVLGAGFGLGQLLLGVGSTHGVAQVEDRLLAFMTGGPRASVGGGREGLESFEETLGRGEAGHFLARALMAQEQRESSLNSCASVYEGQCFNLFVSGPAAAVALGLMYLQTDDAPMAAKMAPPNRRTAIQKLTPLLCHLRSTMASLILWRAIVPTRVWLFAQLPSSLLELATSTTTVTGLATQQRNYLLMNLAHCTAGHVTALGLRYAGTMDKDAREVIFAELQGFLSGHVGTTGAAIPAVQRVTGAYESCILACASALSFVMAGTGDLKVSAALQHLHQRTNVPYGSHMAISMSLGLLFLGSGRLTLSNNMGAVVALFMAFYPFWPSGPEDNTHHLQALRHLYGLAVIPRVMDVIDAVSHQPVSVPVRIVLRGSDTVTAAAENGAEQESTTSGSAPPVERSSRVIHARTPCLYPPVEMIERVELRSPQHYPLIFHGYDVELNRSANLMLCVMAKDGTAGGGASGLHRTFLESRLLDWLHRICKEPRTTAAETLTMIDGVRVMQRVQQRLMATAFAGELTLSTDFSAAMNIAMQRRYENLFLHAAPACWRSEFPPHPLYQLIVEWKAPEEVMQSMVAHPRGTVSFPCDLTRILGVSSARNTITRTTDSQWEDEEVEVGEVSSTINYEALHRWFMEALHFLGLKRRQQQQIHDALVMVVGDRCAQSSSQQSASVTRLTTLLKLQAATQLPLTTLERVWDCCSA